LRPSNRLNFRLNSNSLNNRLNNSKRRSRRRKSNPHNSRYSLFRNKRRDPRIAGHAARWKLCRR
jgi:hypothetical protein